MENKSISQEFKILRAIEKTFIDNHNKYSPLDEKDFFITCPANVSLITAKSELGKKLLLRFLNVDDNGKPVSDKKNPALDYTSKEIAKSKFSLEYLNNLLAIFDYSDAVSITLKKNFPITIENGDFKVILAPRIEEDE